MIKSNYDNSTLVTNSPNFIIIYAGGYLAMLMWLPRIGLGV